MGVLNKDGTPTLAQPSIETIDAMVGPDDDLLHMNFPLPFNRTGDFTIELKATDKVSKATSKVRLPLKVLPAN